MPPCPPCPKSTLLACEQFSIEENADGTPRATRDYLYADAAVECGTDEHASFIQIAFGLIVLWPVGVPALFATLLRVASPEAKTATPLWRATSFLHGEYRPEYRWWEVLELLRKLTLTGFLFLVPQRLSTMRMIVAILVSVSHAVLLPAAQPYKQPSTMLMATVTSVTLVCTLNFAMLVRVHAQLDLPQISLFFGFGSMLPLAMIIFGFNMVVVAAAAALFAYESRLASGQFGTLRLQETGEPPLLTLAQGKRWHLFVSHNW